MLERKRAAKRLQIGSIYKKKSECQFFHTLILLSRILIKNTEKMDHGIFPEHTEECRKSDQWKCGCHLSSSRAHYKNLHTGTKTGNRLYFYSFTFRPSIRWMIKIQNLIHLMQPKFRISMHLSEYIQVTSMHVNIQLIFVSIFAPRAFSTSCIISYLL
jgi:hypothetical protein